MKQDFLTLYLQTNRELEVILTRQAKTESKSREANQKAESERGLISKELGTVRNELSAIWWVCSFQVIV